MSLEEYKSKRQSSTPEPQGGPVERLGPPMFVVQYHRATREHFDFRIEVEGVLKSWAVPRGPHDDPEEKRFATQTEDHPFSYGAFEGVIPANRYGAGEVLLWDFGTWYCDEHAPLVQKPEDWFDPEFRKAHEAAVLKAMDDGKLSLFLRGGRLKGSYFFVRTKEGWLFIKHRDPWAKVTGEFSEIKTSILTNRNWEELARNNPPLVPWSFEEASSGTMGDPNKMVPHGPVEDFPEKLQPMKADISQRAFISDKWIFEPKLDGIRVMVLCQGQRVQVITRNGNDQSSQFPEIVRQLQQQNAWMVIDGEIVAFEDGKPGFGTMMKRFHLKDVASLEQADRQYPCVLFAFDMPYVNGMSLRGQPLRERTRWLRQQLLPLSRIKVVDQFENDGITFYQAAVSAGFEGVIAKLATSRYDASGKRNSNWLKIKAETTADFVICGLSQGEGHRASTFGSLYLGARDEQGDLRFVGRVGSGFKDEQAAEIFEELKPLISRTNPYVGEVNHDGPYQWLRPEKVVEVKYNEMMPSGHVRGPVFLRLRPDLDPSEIQMPPVGVSVTVDEPSLPSETKSSDTIQLLSDSLSDSVLEQLARPDKNQILSVGGTDVSVTNLDKKLWPNATKRDLLIYLTKVSPYMLPHLRNRPMTLIRYPNGIYGQKFFQKHSEHRPDWVETAALWGDTNKRNQEYVVVGDLRTLLWLGQLGTLEFHVPAGRLVYGPDGENLPLSFTDADENLENSLFNYPDFIRFDLDPYLYSGKEKPGEEPELNREAFEKCKTVAFWIHDMLKPLGMNCYVKTTGKTGLHLFVPIVRDIDTQAARMICATFCQTLERAHPKVVTTEWSVPKRTGKIFLDYNMNAMGKTLGAAYSPRATESLAISMPLTWDELANCYPEDFTLFTGPELLAKRGDAWTNILDAKVDLSALVGA